MTWQQANREANRLVDQAIALQNRGRFIEADVLLDKAEALLDEAEAS